MTAHVCVPVLKRYDRLRKLIASLATSSVSPSIHIIDNGRSAERLAWAIDGSALLIQTYEPPQPMGVAESWNWFIKQTDGERIIANDDIEFAPESLAAFLAMPGDIVGHAGINLCSCFLLRDSCVEKVGLFDETISPGYAYFEDCDYAERIAIAGAVRVNVSCDIQHAGSQTPATFTEEEWREHSRRFAIAQDNFIAKWGFHPAHGRGEHPPMSRRVV